jgi:hypothetical protein
MTPRYMPSVSCHFPCFWYRLYQMQAMTARASFVMTSHPSKTTAAANASIG